MNKTDVPGTFREMWHTRPARPRDDRQVAGVAAALARRYDLDPTLVRIAFVVAAFTGVGAALYLAGWIALPEEPADPAAPPARRSPRPILVIALAIAAVVSIGSVFGRHGGWFLPLVAVAVLLYLLHRSRGQRGLPPGGDAPTVETAAGTGAEAAGGSDPGGEAAGHTGARTPPSWDPLGAAPFAWDLPEPSPDPAPEPPRRRLPVTAVTLGAALLAGAATLGILLMTGHLGLGSIPLLLGVPLAVVGLGLVVGAFLHSGRGLIPFALLLGALAWGSLAAPLHAVDRQGVGDVTLRPASLAQLQPAYHHGAGDVVVDLRGLDLTGAAGVTVTPVTTSVTNGFGDVEVLVPADADVQLHATAGAGDVQLDGRTVRGPGARMDQYSPGTGGVATERPLVLDVHTGAGDVTVRHD